MHIPNNKIVPHLWFDKEAKEAANFYVSIFQNSNFKVITTISGTPGGNADIVSFSLWGSDIMAISAGPIFKFNPSVSLFVYCGSENEIDRIYKALMDGGQAMMPLDKYPWSPKYAWVQDRYGLTWQLDMDEVNSKQKIVPTLLFVNEKQTKVKEALMFYHDIFPKSRMIMEAPHEKSSNLPDGSLLFAQYNIGGTLINAMSSNLKHDYDFNEALSLIVYCENQEEIDYYWEKLTHDGQEQSCGWLKDKYGVSWQIVPRAMDQMMQTTNKEQLNRVTKAMLTMRKLELKKLQDAFYNK